MRLLQGAKAHSFCWPYRHAPQRVPRSCPNKKHSWTVLKSAGEDARTTADQEIGATVSSIAVRRSRWTTVTEQVVQRFLGPPSGGGSIEGGTPTLETL